MILASDLKQPAAAPAKPAPAGEPAQLEQMQAAITSLAASMAEMASAMTTMAQELAKRQQ